MEGSCEHGNKPSSSTGGRALLGQIEGNDICHWKYIS